MGKFIYILNHKSYKEYLKEGFYRFIPDKLLNKLEKRIKPRIVCSFLGKNDEGIKGYGVGVSLLSLKDNKEMYIERLIKALRELEFENADRIIFDDIQLFNNDDVIKIQEGCNLRIVNGRKTLLSLTLKTIMEICKISDKDIRNQEFLIIGDFSDNIRKLALEIAKEVNYLTIYGLDESLKDEVADEILNETGLAIYSTYDINNKIHKYNFIINLSINPNVAINRLRKKAIVLDLGAGRGLSYDIRGLRKDIMAISDFVFKSTDYLACTRKKTELGKELASHIYEGVVEKTNIIDLIKIKIHPRTYTIKQACDVFLKSNSNKTKLNVNT